jgi:imidazolonepropionase-like amidohydrolase
VNLQFFRCILLFLFGIAVFGNPARADEHGDLKLFFLQNPVGQEHYDLTSSPHELVLQASFGYSERESTIHLDATLRMKADATPEEFVADGKSYRPFSVHAKFVADAVGKSAAVEDGGASRQVSLPNRYFAISGYAPLSVQMMLLRYWNRHGKPARLAQFPAGTGVADILIDVAGQDNIEVNGRTAHLTRYSVRNVVWGRESVWLDDSEQIAAATTYAGGLPLEAIRPEYAGALQQLIHAAVTDRLNEAAELKRSIRPIAEDAFAISGVNLIDGTGHGPIADATVLVRDGRVVAAGRAREVSIPVGVRVINAPGATLLPGLWDMHAHFAQTDWGPAYLAAGVTSARDCGNEFEFITKERDAISEGRVLGPRVLLAGLVDGSGPKSFGTTWADTPEQARPVVDRYKAAGFAQMKIYDWIRLDVLRAITVEAHRQGMTVTGHIPRGLSAMQAVEAGMDQINHIGSVFQAIAGPAAGPLDLNSATATKAIQFFREHNTVIDPTLSWNELLGRPMNFDIASFEPGFAKAPYVLTSLIRTAGTAPASAVQSRRFHESLEVVKALHDAGIPIVAGTDKGIPAHSLHRELELYVEAGISPMDVIRLATDGAARAMGVDKDLGTVEAGKRADLVLVDGNPLADFSALRRVTRVISNGRMYDSSELWRSVDFQP